MEFGVRNKNASENRNYSKHSEMSNEEEERLRLLFISCDSNGDGNLDRNDLYHMCKELNMEENAEDIISALGANIKGAEISFSDFLRCRSRIQELCKQNNNNNGSTPEYLVHSPYYSQPIHEECGTGSCSDISGIYSSVDCDSGTQDQSQANEEPLSLHAMLQQCQPELYCRWMNSERESGCVDNNGRTLSQKILHYANQIHLSRINRMYSELKIAARRISTSNSSRDMYQKEISRLQKEKDRLTAELQNQASRYEDRLTELHGVIGELHKKIDKRDRNVIVEEDEDGLESAAGNLGANFGVAEDYEKLDLGIRRIGGGGGGGGVGGGGVTAADWTGSMETSAICSQKEYSSASNLVSAFVQTIEPVDMIVTSIQKDNSNDDFIHETSEKQLTTLHHSHVYLQEKLSGYETLICNLRNQLSGLLEEKEALRRQLRDLQDSIDSSHPSVNLLSQQQQQQLVYPVTSAINANMNIGTAGSNLNFYNNTTTSKISLDSKSTTSSSSSPARPVMGVRHQQNKQKSQNSNTAEPDWVIRAVSKFQQGQYYADSGCGSGSGIGNNNNNASNNINNSSNNNNNNNYLSHSSLIYNHTTAVPSIINGGHLFLQELCDNIQFPSLTEPLRRIGLEWQKFSAVTDRESADKLLLQATLAESKAVSDQLQCWVAQLQSDVVAFARSNLLADHIIELMDVLLQLQETYVYSGGGSVSNSNISNNNNNDNNNYFSIESGLCSGLQQNSPQLRQHIQSSPAEQAVPNSKNGFLVNSSNNNNNNNSSSSNNIINNNNNSNISSSSNNNNNNNYNYNNNNGRSIDRLRQGYREQVETAARLLLSRLEDYSSPGLQHKQHQQLNQHSGNNPIHGGRQTPDSGAGVSSTVSSGSVDVEAVLLRGGGNGDTSNMTSGNEEQRLRRMLESLSRQRACVRQSIVTPIVQTQSSIYPAIANAATTAMAAAAPTVSSSSTSLNSHNYYHYQHQYQQPHQPQPHHLSTAGSIGTIATAPGTVSSSCNSQTSLHRNQYPRTPDYDSLSMPPAQYYIENSILVQEVCNLKEERATLKTRLYLMEKEIRSLQLSLESKVVNEKALKVQLSAAVSCTTPDVLGGGSTSLNYNGKDEALHALEELRARSANQQQQNEELQADLKKANAALIGAFEKAKRKYQLRISKLENQLNNNNNNNNICSSSKQTQLASEETAL